ncbi:MAG: hypothetical protein ACYCW7_14275, partial [Pseudomonadaceae bacterium]
GKSMGWFDSTSPKANAAMIPPLYRQDCSNDREYNCLAPAVQSPEHHQHEASSSVDAFTPQQGTAAQEEFYA